MEGEKTFFSLIIFIITIVASIYAMYFNESLYEKWLLSPWKLIHRRKWYTIITSGFIHADMMHLIFNMLTFYFFAFKLEQITGSVNFLIIYFGSMVLADVTTILKHKDNINYRSVGASGAISGVIFSFILFVPYAKIGLLFLPFMVPAPIFGILYLAYCYWAARSSNDMINHEAHFWGALAGVILTVFLYPNVLENFIGNLF